MKNQELTDQARIEAEQGQASDNIKAFHGIDVMAEVASPPPVSFVTMTVPSEPVLKVSANGRVYVKGREITHREHPDIYDAFMALYQRAGEIEAERAQGLADLRALHGPDVIDAMLAQVEGAEGAKDRALLATLGELNDAILAGTERTGESWLKVQAGSSAATALAELAQVSVGSFVARAPRPALTEAEQAAEDYRNAITDLIDLHGPDRINPLLAAGPQFFSAALVADPDPGCEIVQDDAPDPVGASEPLGPEDAVEVVDYDHSIHVSPDADLWARFYCQHYPTADLDCMRGWFANAMMAMHDHLLGAQRRAREAARPQVREALAAHAHAVWARWMAWQGEHADLTPKAVRGSDGGLDYVKNVDAVRRWERQQGTPYADLSEAERASDRAIADEYLAILDGGAL